MQNFITGGNTKGMSVAREGMKSKCLVLGSPSLRGQEEENKPKRATEKELPGKQEEKYNSVMSWNPIEECVSKRKE